MANLPATQDSQKEVAYTAADGQEVRLTMDMVRKYLVQGHGEMVTVQEMVYFLNICRSRKLNPFIKDCYLIKYSAGDPAAIVTSVNYFRKRARVQKDCKGWRSGIIVLDKDGKVKDTAGLILDGETLVGGWFEAKPEGWTDPLRLEVNLRGYIKKTKEGNATRFWSVENQPSQIQKVAESQGLRKLWPDEFSSIYSEEEITQADRSAAIDLNGGSAETETPESILQRFEDSIPKGTDPALLDAYITRIAESNKKTVDEIKLAAASDPKELQSFWKLFPAWCKQQKVKPKGESKPEEKKGPAFTEAEELAPAPCPNNGDNIYTKKYCDKCSSRVGCPAWDSVDNS